MAFWPVLLCAYIVIAMMWWADFPSCLLLVVRKGVIEAQISLSFEPLLSFLSPPCRAPNVAYRFNFFLRVFVKTLYCSKCEENLPECSSCYMLHCVGTSNPSTDCLVSCEGNPACREVGFCTLLAGLVFSEVFVFVLFCFDLHTLHCSYHADFFFLMVYLALISFYRVNVTLKKHFVGCFCFVKCHVQVVCRLCAEERCACEMCDATICESCRKVRSWCTR